MGPRKHYRTSGGGLSVLTAVLLLVAAIVPSWAIALEDGRSMYMVELKGSSISEGGSASEIAAQQDRLRAYISAQGLDATLTIASDYRTLFNGIAVRVAGGNAGQSALVRLSLSKDVRAIGVISQDQVVDLPRTIPAEHTQMRGASYMTRVQQARAATGLTGAGVKVAIIDTGVDWKHPAFAVPGQKCEAFGGPGCRVVGGKDFVGQENSNDTSIANTPMDCMGHGAYVAGIIGGKDGDKFEGVAPNVSLLAYRVGGCVGAARTPDVLSAMEAAVNDGADVVNVSLGDSHVSYQDRIFSRAVRAMRKLGVMVVAAINNDGHKGLFTIVSPALSNDGFGVASVDNKLVEANVIKGLPVHHPVVVFHDQNAGGMRYDEELTVATSPAGPDADRDACQPFGNATLFQGQVALIRRGGCSTEIKARQAQDAGAAGVLLFNNSPGLHPVEQLLSGTNVTIPVAFVDDADGRSIYLNSIHRRPSFQISFAKDPVLIANPLAGQPSALSSWGPGTLLEVKPDISTPGGETYSAWPLHVEPLGGYTTASGTSNASPFLAGVLALDVERRNAAANAAERTDYFANAHSRILTTARPIPVAGLPRTVLWPVVRQGAGLVDALAFLNSKVEITPPRIQLGHVPNRAAAARKKEVKITIRNNAARAVAYTISHDRAGSVAGDGGRGGGELAVSFDGIAVEIRPRLVQVPRGGKATITLAFDFSRGSSTTLLRALHWIVSGYIVLDPRGGEALAQGITQLRVPYAGMLGDYRTMPMLKSPIEDAAFVSTNKFGYWDFAADAPMPSGEPKWRPGDDIASFSLTDDNRPVLYFNLAHPTRDLDIALHDEHGKFLGIVATEESVAHGHYIPSLTGFEIVYANNSSLPMKGWTGMFFRPVSATAARRMSAPNGKYTFRLRVRKPDVQLPYFAGKNASLAQLQQEPSAQWPISNGRDEIWASPVITIARPAGVPVEDKVSSTTVVSFSIPREMER